MSFRCYACRGMRLYWRFYRNKCIRGNSVLCNSYTTGRVHCRGTDPGFRKYPGDDHARAAQRITGNYRRCSGQRNAYGSAHYLHWGILHERNDYIINHGLDNIFYG